MHEHRGFVVLAHPLGSAPNPCHLRSMAKSDDAERAPKAGQGQDLPQSREEKLAKALRDNLKRRKAKKD